MRWHLLLGRSGGQFSQFTKVEPTNVPAFVMHRRKALSAVGGWDETFITSQDSDLSMRLLKAGYSLYRHPATTVKMHKRSGLKQWWKMGHRYGFWRTKKFCSNIQNVQNGKNLCRWLGCSSQAVLIGLSSPWALFPILLYGLALMAGGAVEALRQGRPSSLLGVPFCLMMLHTSFSLGLVDGLLRKGRLPSDRG